MDLYDDIDTKQRTAQVDGWSSGIKMLQTQLAIKKAQAPKEPPKKPLITPLLNLRVKKPLNTTISSEENNINDENILTNTQLIPNVKNNTVIQGNPLPILETNNIDEWDFVDEYDPQWPNEYDKLKKKQQQKDSNKSRDDRDNRNNRNKHGGKNDENDRKRRNRGGNSQLNNDTPSKKQALDEPLSPNANLNKVIGGGAAIAPPPSLQEPSLFIGNDNGDSSSNVTIPYSASSVAAKIMAKYGFKDGQGLGKQEQGMSMALQVEKTSKRGGRIIHEKDVLLPPPLSPAPIVFATPTVNSISPPNEIEENETSIPSITEIMKEPSKVVLLRNMVGPGDVDEELEPEVKDECNTKYGEVTSVVIHEAFGTTPEEAIKIYVEFKRIESAIKAVVDLNGRFFGGRQVRAGFYNFDKFKKLQLN